MVFYADGEYAGRQMRPNPQWLHGGGVPLLNDVTLSEIIWRVDDATGTRWNSLLINLYEDGSDYQRWHSREKVWNRRRTEGPLWGPFPSRTGRRPIAGSI